MNAISNNIRHAVAAQTGATTLAFRTGRAEWEVQCLSHTAKTTVANRGVAWTTSSHPATFCAKCKAIAAGKAKRIEKGNKVPMPATKAARAKATRADAKKATPVAPTEKAPRSPRRSSATKS